MGSGRGGASAGSPEHGASDTQQRDWRGLGARGVYSVLCKEHNCKANSGLAATLPDRPEDFNVHSLDMSMNMVGAKGVVPVMEVARLSQSLRTVDLRDNYLDNAAVRTVCVALKDHPSVESIDFSSNPISWTAGMSILELVQVNPTVLHVGMTDTFLKPNIVSTIEQRLRHNQAVQAKRKAKGPNPTNHPLTIRMRALKRVFNEIVVREGQNGRVPKRCIVEGYKENMRMQSREAELEQHSVAFYDELKRRCNADEFGLIGWETFLVISMVDDIGFSKDEIEELKGCFSKFDADSNGFIDLFELKAVVTAMCGGVQPSEEYVREKMRMYDADGSNTITLDEFVVMMVDKGPQPGGTTLLPHCPAPQRRAPHAC